jgi:co-chaperonin GroES (HSP10)
MLELKAVGHRVMVKPDPVEKVTDTGIILSVNEKMEAAASQKGTVIGIGPMAWKNEVYGFGLPGWEPWCKVGDRVFFARYAGKFINTSDDPKNSERVVVLNDEDVQAVIVKE